MRAPSAERGLVALDTVGVAPAVPALVVRAHDRATPAKAKAAKRMRSPSSVCQRMSAHSCSSSGPGLARMTTLPMSCICAARASSSSVFASIETLPHGAGERGDRAHVLVGVVLALALHAEQDVVA